MDNQDLHGFGVTEAQPLCSDCWQASRCPRQFAHAPSEHETLLGLLPLGSQPAQRLLQQVRPWIEPAQAFEKNQLGLRQVCFNRLRPTWCMSLLADAADLLRALALRRTPRRPKFLSEQWPPQTAMAFIAPDVPGCTTRAKMMRRMVASLPHFSHVRFSNS